MPAKQKPARHMWTPEEKEALILRVEKAREEGANITLLLEKEKINSSWYYRKLIAYKKTHPVVKLKTGAAQPKLVNGWPADPEERKKEMLRRMSIRKQRAKEKPSPTAIVLHSDSSELPMAQRSPEEKARLLREYEELDYGEKITWRKRYSVSTGALSYYKAHEKSVAKSVANGSSSKNPNRASLVKEYLRLPSFTGDKAAWLKRHNLNQQKIFELKRKAIAAGELPSDPNQHWDPNVLQGAAGSGLNHRHPPRQPLTPDLIPHQLMAPTPPTLADAILAMEVKRDQLNNFIEELKRMQKGLR